MPFFTYVFTYLLTCVSRDTDEQVDSLLRNTFRPANVLITDIQICIIIWILGQLLHSLHPHGGSAPLVGKALRN